MSTHSMPLRPGVQVRPATHGDTASGFGDLQPDLWRAGDNRRSFVAVDGHGAVLGHCRGIDNVFHPESRALVLECTDEGWNAGAADALLAAQVEVSKRPLRMKLSPSDEREMALAVRFGAVVEQLCPPWRRVVGPALRDWAAVHRGQTCAATPADADDLRELWVDHYLDQHAAWSPAAPRDVLLRQLHDDFVPGSDTCFDIARTVVLRRGDRIVAAAIVWPDDEPEVGLVSRPHRGPASVRDRQACLAAVVEASDDGDALLVDSHLTERDEYEMMRATPGLDPDAEWLALVAVPAAGGLAPRPIDPQLVPEEVLTTMLGSLWPARRPVAPR